MPQGKHVPDGFVRVRSHIRRLPTARGGGNTKRGLSGWTIAALIAGVWLWGQVFGFGDAGAEEPATSETSVSESADRR
ncbi:hypothetical protein FH609_003960 [Streptomyces sp. 3MP-14]|uniref:Uncharacterized protein n=2 Tax=Streptomyces TaxID=1883 RepID=A0A5N6A3S0_9ACTN|nr:hypothetical protein FH607_019825 [Streptomyces mimosae]KAB8179105.1 hypothetical protein FH609_003960 [Streptomyces sp. 3MP-14]RMI44144.1 hypothetical protein EBN88_05965 [Streptomyces triticirhizae]